MRRWFLWAPVVMVASMLYWTVALGLGGLSLMAASALSVGQTLPVAGLEQAGGRYDQSYDPILVHLEESSEPQDVNDNAGCGYSSTDAEPQPGDEPGPGQTAF
jgi:hypothetical protein